MTKMRAMTGGLGIALLSIKLGLCEGTPRDGFSKNTIENPKSILCDIKRSKAT